MPMSRDFILFLLLEAEVVGTESSEGQPACIYGSCCCWLSAAVQPHG